jgi:multiple sugar transport system permease protein
VLVPLVVEAVWVFWPAAGVLPVADQLGRRQAAPTFVGLGNYTEMFSDDPVFRGALLEHVIWLVLFGGLSAVGGLGWRCCCSGTPRRRVYRAALFTPVVFSLVGPR